MVTDYMYKNAYFEVNGDRYWVEVSITPADEKKDSNPDVDPKNVPRYTEENNN